MTDPRDRAERLTSPAEADAERLAALLDGRLDERQRAEAVERLASSDEEFEAFVDALAVTRELEAEEAAAGVTPLRPRARQRWWQRPGGHWAAVAAVLVGLALLPVLWSRSRGPDTDDPKGYAALLEAEGAALPARWNRSPWRTTRGAGDSLTPEARAVRLGAWITDLEVAILAGDPRVRGFAADVMTLLEEVPGAGPTATAFRRIRDHDQDSPEKLLDELREGREGIIGLVDADLLDLGRWAEAARFAAARRDADFFRKRASRAALQRAAEIPFLGEPARSAIERIRSNAGADGGPDWASLERDLAELLRAAGT